MKTKLGMRLEIFVLTLLSLDENKILKDCRIKMENFKWKILFRIEWGEKEGSQIVLTKDKG